MPPATGTQRPHQLRHAINMPADGILLAAEPCAGGAPPDGAYLERWRTRTKNEYHTEDGGALQSGEEALWS